MRTRSAGTGSHAEIEPDEITRSDPPIYERRCRAMADHVRGYIHAAYSWGMKSEHDYPYVVSTTIQARIQSRGRRPTEPKKVGTRWLDEEEFVRLYRWLECPDAPVHPPYTRARACPDAYGTAGGRDCSFAC